MEPTRPVTINPLAEEIYGKNPKQPEKGYFHKWTTKKHQSPKNYDVFEDVDFGLIEMTDGQMRYYRPDQIVFDAVE